MDKLIFFRSKNKVIANKTVLSNTITTSTAKKTAGFMVPPSTETLPDCTAIKIKTD